MASIAFIEVTATVSYGGVQTAIWKYARHLAALGHDVTVYGGKIPGDAGGTTQPVETGAVQVRTHAFRSRERFPNFGNRFRKLAERYSFARHARDEVFAADHDWAILHKPFDFFWPRFRPKGCSTRFAFMSGGTDFFVGDRRLARRIDRWFACSHFNAWQISHHFHRYPQVLFHGVDADEFEPDLSGADLKGSLGLAPEAVVFGFAGRVVGWKGLETAIRAVASDALKALPVQVLVVGDGPQRSELRRLALSLGVGAKVVFHDRVVHGELPKLYSAIDVGLFPSVADEAFGITIAEAMSCGKPVICSYIGGIPEVVGNEGTCGLLVAPGDVNALASAMVSLAEDEPQRRRMGGRARERIVKQFSWSGAAQRLSNALTV